MMSNQNYDSVNRNSDITPNLPIYNTPTYEIPSNYPITGIDISSSIDSFDKYMFDRMMDESQSYDMLVREGVENATKEIMNQREDQKIIKTYQKKSKNLVRESNFLKKDNIMKGKWDESEDRKLKEIVEVCGNKKWRMIAKKLEGRTGKQCRERWYNHLRPDIKKEAWTEEEDQILIKAHTVVGTKWVEIAQQLPGRSENTIKNHWNTTKRRMQKHNDENTIMSDTSILENYIRSVIVNNDDHPKSIETSDKTTNTTNDDNGDMLYGGVDLSLDARMHMFEPLLDVSSVLPYVPMPETFIWEDYTELLMDGWE